MLRDATCKYLLVLISCGVVGAPVFVLVWAASPVFAVMVVGTGIALAAKTRWLLTKFCLVVGQHVVVF